MADLTTKVVWAKPENVPEYLADGYKKALEYDRRADGCVAMAAPKQKKGRWRTIKPGPPKKATPRKKITQKVAKKK